jgi:hypothetical protein
MPPLHPAAPTDGIRFLTELLWIPPARGEVFDLPNSQLRWSLDASHLALSRKLLRARLCTSTRRFSLHAAPATDLSNNRSLGRRDSYSPLRGSRAMENRPELMAQTLRIRAEVRIRAASAEYKPQTALSGSDAQTSLWPSADWVSSVPRSSLLGPSND